MRRKEKCQRTEKHQRGKIPAHEKSINAGKIIDKSIENITFCQNVDEICWPIRGDSDFGIVL
jgi:hypothetical protein